MNKKLENVLIDYVLAPILLIGIIALVVFLLSTAYMAYTMASTGNFNGAPTKVKPPVPEGLYDLVPVVKKDLFDIVQMNVSAYCLCEKCCGIWAEKGVDSEGNRVTASGAEAKGKLIAAPRTYDFGTLMDVPGYGFASVEDRGGAIKGNKIDLLFPSHQEALEWGRHKNTPVKVYK